jgi:cation diffusion facilitator CzcD-associated flavoprotein CzcO
MNSLTESETLDASVEIMRALFAAVPQEQQPPSQTAVVILGAGLTGLSLAAAFSVDGELDMAVFEKTRALGGVWAHYGNSFSRVNVSGPGYHLPTSRARVRASIMHPYHHDVLADVLDVIQAHHLSRCIHLKTEVRSVVAKSDHTRNWIVSGSLAGVSSFETTSKFVCVYESPSRVAARTHICT